MRIVKAVLKKVTNLHDYQFPVKVVIDGFEKPISLRADEALALSVQLASCARRACYVALPSEVHLVQG